MWRDGYTVSLMKETSTNGILLLQSSIENVCWFYTERNEKCSTA